MFFLDRKRIREEDVARCPIASALTRKKLVLPERAVSLSPRKKQPLCPVRVCSKGLSICCRSASFLNSPTDWLPSPH